MNREQAELLLAVVDAKLLHQEARAGLIAGTSSQRAVEAATEAFLASFDQAEPPVGTEGIWFVRSSGWGDPVHVALEAAGAKVNYTYLDTHRQPLVVCYKGPRVEAATRDRPA